MVNFLAVKSPVIVALFDNNEPSLLTINVVPLPFPMLIEPLLIVKPSLFMITFPDAALIVPLTANIPYNVELLPLILTPDKSPLNTALPVEST